MLSRFCFFISILCLGVFHPIANAEILDGDYLSKGDSDIFLDTNTGLEWLSINFTSGKSINEVKQSLEQGGFEGFRLATEDEIIKLWENFYNPVEGALYVGALDLYYESFGYVFGRNNVKFAYGLVENSDGQVVLYGNREDGDISYYNYWRSDYTIDVKYEVYGVYLVSDDKISYSSIHDEYYKESSTPNNVNSPFYFWFLGSILLFCKIKFLRSPK